MEKQTLRLAQLNTLEREFISDEEVIKRLEEIRSVNSEGNVYLLAAKVYAVVVEAEIKTGKLVSDYLENYRNAIENFERGLN